MARGWKSKAIEAQQEEASTRRPPAPTQSPEERERDARRALLALALADARTMLHSVSHPAHRDMLQMKVAALENQIRLLA